MAYPEFPRPMSERLIELAPEFLLPGLEQVPPNTVTLVQPHARFIEAFMVGLNHEMGRELLWREYPTDRRGTYFKYFWDEGGTAPTQSTVDLPPIHRWAKALGQNTSEGRPEPLILLVRGQLFRRYPNALLYAAKAERDTAGRIKPGATERFPLFRGVAPPDVTFFGFQLTEAEARGGAQPGGDPGWFFVIQQQPGEPEFGLDVDPGGDPPPVTEWNQLTWRHLVAFATRARRVDPRETQTGSSAATRYIQESTGRHLGIQRRPHGADHNATTGAHRNPRVPDAAAGNGK